MLRQGRPAHPAEGLMSQLPYPAAQFDLIVCGLAVGHIVTPRLWATLAEGARVLRPGGLFLLSDVHPVQAWRGAKRTFQAGGVTLAVEHYIHSYADYHAAARQVGLLIEAVQEVPAQLDQAPVLLAICLKKPSP
jgi:malonyl-CoA O-methyltransferase